MLVMDNASFHNSGRIEQMCSEAGVKLVYLPPYSPDLNPIEESFTELRAFIRRKWQSYEANPDQNLILSSNGVLMSSARDGEAQRVTPP